MPGEAFEAADRAIGLAYGLGFLGAQTRDD